MANAEIIDADPDHIASIATRMRKADVDEVDATGGFLPADALRMSVEKSAMAKTCLFAGVPEVMFGVGDLNVLTRTGAPWLLGTDAVHDNYRTFLRLSVQWRAKLLQRYDVLTNIVDDRNEASIRWLRWLGFKFSGPMPLGKDGQMFRIFRLEKRKAYD